MSEAMGRAFVAAARESLKEGREKIAHCVGQMLQEDLGWRPFEQANSVTNIVLHVCGNLGQWVLHGVGGRPDVRDRPGEFADRSVITRDELIRRLDERLAEVDAVLASVAADDLLTRRRIQGFDTDKLSAIFDTVAHFRGHVQEIIYITRLRLGERYKFYWVPEGTEQTSAGG